MAESRFQRIAMSLGDGLICPNSNYLITVWNTGAVAMFGYRAEDMIGKPFEAICAKAAIRCRSQRRRSPGAVVEFYGRRNDGEVFPVEASFSGWQGRRGFLRRYGAIVRNMSVRKREAEKISILPSTIH